MWFMCFAYASAYFVSYCSVKYLIGIDVGTVRIRTTYDKQTQNYVHNINAPMRCRR